MKVMEMGSESILSMTGDMILLARVAEAGSISGGSRAAGLERTTVSRRLSRLESRLGASLLNRSNRQVSLTDAGLTYLQYCLRVIEAVEDGAAKLKNYDVIPDRKLKIELAVPDAGRFVRFFAGDYPLSYPDRSVAYKISDKLHAEFDDDCDLAIQLGNCITTGKIVTSFNSIPQSVWISPTYKGFRPLSLRVHDLVDLDCISCTESDEPMKWQFQQGQEKATVEITPRFKVDNLVRCRDVCVEGTGIALLPDYMCLHLAETGALERVMVDWVAMDALLSVVQLDDQFLHRGARAFIKYLRKEG